MSMNIKYIESLLAPLATGDLKLAALSDSWLPDGTEEFYADISTYAVAPPVALSGVSVFYNDVELFVGLLFDDVQITTSDTITGPLSYVVIYLDTGDNSTSRIIGYEQLDGTIYPTSPDSQGGIAYSPYDQGFFQVYGLDPSELP